MIPLQTGSDPETAILLVGLVTAVVGAFVAYQALRGYLRNESRPMLYLGVGIALLTALPFLVNNGLDWFTAATSAQQLLAVTVSNIAGLAAILYSLTRA